MKNTFSLQQIQKTSNLDASLISRHYKLNLMADFMRVNYESPKLRQSEIANQLGLSSSTLQRYRNDISMLSPYRSNPNNTNKPTKNVSNINFDNNSYRDYDLQRIQLTSNDLEQKRLQTLSLRTTSWTWCWKTSNDLRTTQTNIKFNKKKLFKKPHPYTRILKLTNTI